MSKPRMSWRYTKLIWQVLLAALLLLAWQYLPDVHWISARFHFLNHFYISSPDKIAQNVYDLSTGHHTNGVTLWPYLRTTVYATTLGTVIGLVLGAIAGLICSNARRLSEVLQPFIVIANSVPRIAIIPIFILIAGPTVKSSILSIVTVVFFLGFFNAFEGGRSLRQPVLDNARLLGATPLSILWRVRLPQTLSWTFAAVPNAISFGLIIAVTTELLTGVRGMGTLLQTSMANIDAAQTFAVIAVLSVVGLILYGLASWLRSWVMRWEG